jgi:hypothetical protein
MMPGTRFVMEDGCKRSLIDTGVVSLDSAFALAGGKDLAKANIGRWRKRIEFKASDGSTFFMKRYDKAPVAEQIKNWMCHGRIDSFASFDVRPSAELARAGIQTPRVAAQGYQWGLLFEKRSVSITEKIPHAESLERRLPKFFFDSSRNGLREKRAFLHHLGEWAASFHASGWRHRDFYLSHIFLTDSGSLYLIDLQRAFKPDHLAERFRRKDIAQLFYSMPRVSFSRTDRMRVYLAYAGTSRLGWCDRRLIASVLLKVGKMTEHDRRHGKTPPYKGKEQDKEV